ncbi:MAG: type I-MYXAN CRISPR-associated protein Cas5/Cmx5/DevS [Chroococcidiopsidaceae cyanobacterium CP_BM_ER_R8_30]|nr:type I-MYXAN CRISPR-associated protein Cas5/Cmx5/DevS [Chroococcidiopsidaceae cyanobacterium CP_BM_ER_R8_30]
MIAIEVEVPIASFRQSRAREYAETYSVPPPSTVYGMLLSMVGEIDRHRHLGTKLAIAMLSEPKQSTVIRTFRRFKRKEISDPVNARPDYQELLSDIRFVVWVDAIADLNGAGLPNRLQQALQDPASIDRFGGLCLGESRDLVNVVTLLPVNYQGNALQWLVQDENGLLTLPIWVDHVGSQDTRWRRYTLQNKSELWQPPEAAWTVIQNI